MRTALRHRSTKTNVRYRTSRMSVRRTKDSIPCGRAGHAVGGCRGAQSGPICLRGCYAVSGTELAYGDNGHIVGPRRTPLPYAVSVPHARAPYASESPYATSVLGAAPYASSVLNLSAIYAVFGRQPLYHTRAQYRTLLPTLPAGTSSVRSLSTDTGYAPTSKREQTRRVSAIRCRSTGHGVAFGRSIAELRLG
eukprot:1582849-Rhodomonas_salina.4